MYYHLLNVIIQDGTREVGGLARETGGRSGKSLVFFHKKIHKLEAEYGLGRGTVLLTRKQNKSTYWSPGPNAKSALYIFKESIGG